MCGSASGLAGVAGCATDDGVDTGNAELGIARFVTEDGPNKTAVIGLDAEGREIGRLELVHGEFALVDEFRDAYDTPTVIGRDLSVNVKGRTFRFQDKGFLPVLHLPPVKDRAYSAFLADPHVKPVLEHWDLGFEPLPEADAYSSTWTLDYPSQGTNPTSCTASSPQSCSVGSIVANTCGGNNNAYSAKRVYQHEGFNWAGSHKSWVVNEVCPRISGQTGNADAGDWAAVKECPADGSTSTNHCGSVTANRCKGCGSIGADKDARGAHSDVTDVWIGTVGAGYEGAGDPIYALTVYGETCHDRDESCTSSTQCCGYNQANPSLSVDSCRYGTCLPASTCGNGRCDATDSDDGCWGECNCCDGVCGMNVNAC